MKPVASENRRLQVGSSPATFKVTKKIIVKKEFEDIKGADINC